MAAAEMGKQVMARTSSTVEQFLDEQWVTVYNHNKYVGGLLGGDQGTV